MKYQRFQNISVSKPFILKVSPTYDLRKCRFDPQELIILSRSTNNIKLDCMISRVAEWAQPKHEELV